MIFGGGGRVMIGGGRVMTLGGSPFGNASKKQTASSGEISTERKNHDAALWPRVLAAVATAAEKPSHIRKPKNPIMMTASVARMLRYKTFPGISFSLNSGFPFLIFGILARARR